MKALYLILLLLIVTACTTTPPHSFVADPDKKWQQRKLELYQLDTWQLNGRVAIVNGDESWHLTIKWESDSEKYILDLAGPFGAGHAQLTGSEDGVTLIDSDKNYFQAQSPDRLLREVTGVRMPVQSLLYWIRGLPNADIKNQKQRIDEFGRLQQLNQDGWRVRFKRYVDITPFELPQKIFIDGHKLKVKIFIDEWVLNKKVASLEKNEG